MAESAAKREAESQPTPSTPQKSRTDFVGFALLGLVTLNILGLIGLGSVVQRLSQRIGELQTNVQKLETAVPAEESATGKEFQPQNLGTLFPLESFLVNVTSEQGQKFLQTQIELELSDAALEDELSRKKAAVRDAVIVLLSSRSFKELRAQNGLKQLRADLVRTINSLVTTGKVKEVYFTQFHFN